MRSAYLIGVSCTRFGKLPAQSFKDLTREAYESVLNDAGLGDGHPIAAAWFSNCGMHTWGQANIRGQVCFSPLVKGGRFPERVPLINVEGGCASGSLALHGAWKDVLSGQSEMSLAIGVEKTFHPDQPEKVAALFGEAIDRQDPGDWEAYYAAAGAAVGKPFATGPGRSPYMDTYAMQASWHMQTFGTTQEQIAIAAAKAHNMGALNPLAQYRFRTTVADVLADKTVSYPLTRAMCSPIGDGAAAALVCSEEFLRTLPPAIQRRAVRIAAQALTGGKYRRFDEPGLSRVAADRAYAMAGVGPRQIDVAEVHDATSFSELYQPEMLRFCGDGEGGAFVASGATALGGSLPINMSGGLVSKGHPIGATGLSMIYELTRQLRGEAGESQVRNARLGLAENGGGVMGFDEAVCAVTILEGNHRT
ncbi:MAG: thiolase family protein [Betaproteobacteria bacterium]